MQICIYARYDFEHLHSADTKLMRAYVTLLSLSCSRQTERPGRPSVTFAFVGGVWMMLFTRSWRCAVSCILNCNPGQLPLRLFAWHRGEARARRAKMHYLQAISRSGSLLSQTPGARNWSFARVGIFAVDAVAKTANSFTNAALKLTVSLACLTTRLTSTLEEATRSLGRLSSGRRYLSPLHHCIPLQGLSHLRNRSFQFLLRLS